MVKHLNANQVGGMTAARLAPNVWRYTLGKTNHTLAHGEHIFLTSLPKGTYQIQISGLLTSGDPTLSGIGDCTTANKNKVLASDASGLYATYEIDFANDVNAPFISAADVETLNAKKTGIIFGCENATGTDTQTVIRPITFTFRQVPVVDKKGKPFSLAKNGHRSLTLP